MTSYGSRGSKVIGVKMFPDNSYKSNRSHMSLSSPQGERCMIYTRGSKSPPPWIGLNIPVFPISVNGLCGFIMGNCNFSHIRHCIYKNFSNHGGSFRCNFSYLRHFMFYQRSVCIIQDPGTWLCVVGPPVVARWVLLIEVCVSVHP